MAYGKRTARLTALRRGAAARRLQRAFRSSRKVKAVRSLAKAAVRRSVPITHARCYQTGRLRHDEPTYLFSPLWVAHKNAKGGNDSNTLMSQGWHPFLPTSADGSDHIRRLRESDRVNGVDLRLKFIFSPLVNGGEQVWANPNHYGAGLPHTFVAADGVDDASLSVNQALTITGVAARRWYQSVRVVVFEYNSLMLGSHPLHRHKWTTASTYNYHHQERNDQPHFIHHAAGTTAYGNSQGSAANHHLDVLDINKLTVKAQQDFNDITGDPIEGFWDDFFVGVNGKGMARFPMGPLAKTSMATFVAQQPMAPNSNITQTSGQYISHYHDDISTGEESNIRVLSDRIIHVGGNAAGGLGGYGSERVVNMRIPLKKLFKWDTDAMNRDDLLHMRSEIVPHRDIAVMVMAHDDIASDKILAGSTTMGFEVYSDFRFRNTVA